MAENFANDVSSSLSSAMVDGTTTTANIVSGTGFPAVSFRIRIDNEYMLVTSLGTGLNWTVTRGIEGTTAVAHTSGTAVYQIVTLGGLLQYITDRFLPLSGGTLTGALTMSGASVLDANASIAAHATTMNPWSLGNYVTATGAAVTFTGMAAAPQIGVEVEMYMNAAHVFTDGAVFEVDGNANYTATIGDRVLLRAKSTTVFTVHPRRSAGFSQITASLGADVALNNTALYFDGPSISQGSVGTWFVSGTVTCQDSTLNGQYAVTLNDGPSIIASARSFQAIASGYTSISLSGIITSPSGNLRISVRNAGSTTGVIAFNSSGNSKDSTITAIRIG